MALYIMSVPSGLRKIGVASNPASRCRELQTGNAELLVLTNAWDVECDGVNARGMERDIHGMLVSYRVRGEWFNAPLPLVLHVFKIAWVRVRYPAVFARWGRLCKRPAFTARYAVLLTDRMAAYPDGYGFVPAFPRDAPPRPAPGEPRTLQREAARVHAPSTGGEAVVDHEIPPIFATSPRFCYSRRP